MRFKTGFIILKYLLGKTLRRRLLVWKVGAGDRKLRKVSKIPLPRHFQNNLARERARPESPLLRNKGEDASRGRTDRSSSAPPKRKSDNEDFGVRLYNKAQEIEEKKRKIRKNSKVEYSFKPQLAKKTEKWLNKSTRENNSPKEEIAVVSSLSILNFSKYVQNMTGPCILSNSKPRPFVANRQADKLVNKNDAVL